MLMRVLVCAVVLVFAAVHGKDCGRCPLCEKESWGRLSCAIRSRSPRASDRPDIKRCLAHMVGHTLIGQDAAVETVVAQVTHKLTQPGTALVLHFAGDNGVGKTLMAYTISLALSLRRADVCGSVACAFGDQLMSLSGPGLQALSDDAVRDVIVQRVTAHLRKYPSGIVLIDDAQVIPPKAFRALAPLLGAGHVFPDHPDVPLNQALVILTTDFGREGRTRSVVDEAELLKLIHEEMAAAYENADVKTMRTVPFLPLGTEDAIRVFDSLVANAPCRFPQIHAAVAGDGVAATIIRELNEDGLIVTRNARAIADRVTDLLDVQVSMFLADFGRDVEVEARLFLDDRGKVKVRVTPRDGLSVSGEL
jgi:ATP-dependent Clp protease ATP-binding subunit ClpA